MNSNYPPGVTGNEPQITGEWDHAEDCGDLAPNGSDFVDPFDCSNVTCSCWCHRDDIEETEARLSMLEDL